MIKESEIIKGEDSLYYIKDTGDIFTGTSEAYFDNGQLRFKGSYKNGKVHGLFEWHHENGHLHRKQK